MKVTACRNVHSYNFTELKEQKRLPIVERVVHIMCI